MKMIGTVLMTLTRIGVFLIASPLMLIQLTESHRAGDIATTTQHIAARDLMTPDEIMQIDSSVQLLRVQGKPVIIVRKLRYFADREFDGLHRSPDAQPTTLNA